PAPGSTRRARPCRAGALRDNGFSFRRQSRICFLSARDRYCPILFQKAAVLPLLGPAFWLAVFSACLSFAITCFQTTSALHSPLRSSFNSLMTWLFMLTAASCAPMHDGQPSRHGHSEICCCALSSSG